MGAYFADDADMFRASASAARPIRAPWLNGTSRASLSRVLWALALPGSVAVLATLTLPGLLLGAAF